MLKQVERESLGAVHTHTHTHTSNLIERRRVVGNTTLKVIEKKDGLGIVCPFCVPKEKQEDRKRKQVKRISLGAVHTHTHTHTHK